MSESLYGYRVGALYHPTRTSWPEDVDYNFRSGQHELRLFLAAPRKQEIEDIRHGRCEFALVETEHALVLLYRFGRSISWSDKPYSWHLVPAEQRTLPEPEATAETRALLTVILVDAMTGILRAFRAVTWSPSFTRAIHAAIRRQAERPWPGDVAYNASVQAVYRRYPSSDVLLTAATARTTGGE